MIKRTFKNQPIMKHKSQRENIFHTRCQVLESNISPFEVVYGFNPHTSLDLLPLPNPHEFVHKEGVTKVEFVKKLHKRIRNQI